MPRAAANQFLTVNVSLKVASFLEVDNKGQTLKVAFVLEKTWYDSRLKFVHLKTNPSLNVLWEKSYEKLWYPRLRFENIDNSKDRSTRHLTYTIYRNPNIEPKLLNPGTENVANIFFGSDHKLVRRQEYNYFWKCVYILKWFPFDRQTCQMKMALPEHYTDFVKVRAERVEYKGDKDELTEYSIEEILFCSQANGTRLVFEVTLGRPLIGSILTIFIPTLLLLVIRFNISLQLLIRWFGVSFSISSPQPDCPSLC